MLGLPNSKQENGGFTCEILSIDYTANKLACEACKDGVTSCTSQAIPMTNYSIVGLVCGEKLSQISFSVEIAKVLLAKINPELVLNT